MENELNNFDVDTFATVFDNNTLLGNDTMEEKTSRTKETAHNKGKSTVVHYKMYSH